MQIQQDQVEQQFQEYLGQVMEIHQISETQAIDLVIKYRFVNALLIHSSEYVAHSPIIELVQYCSECGEESECSVMDCGCDVCQNCWKKHIVNRIRLKLLPECKCGQNISFEFMITHLEQSVVKQVVIENYMKCQQYYMKCVQCTRLLYSTDSQIKCVCGCLLCTICKQQYHYPCTCQEALQIISICRWCSSELVNSNVCDVCKGRQTGNNLQVILQSAYDWHQMIEPLIEQLIEHYTITQLDMEFLRTSIDELIQAIFLCKWTLLKPDILQQHKIAANTLFEYIIQLHDSLNEYFSELPMEHNNKNLIELIIKGQVICTLGRKHLLNLL